MKRKIDICFKMMFRGGEIMRGVSKQKCPLLAYCLTLRLKYKLRSSRECFLFVPS